MATLSEAYKVILGVGGVTGTTGTERPDTQTFLLPLPGTAFDDHYYQGLGGNDPITGQLADDYIEGGAGADVFVDLGPGVNDTLGYLNSNEGVTVTLNALGGLSVAQGGHATGDVSVGALLAGFENLVGSEFKDTLTGNGGANKILGMGGDDNINGGAGDDTLIGGNGDDIIYGGLGNDKIYGGNGHDQLNGNDGNDTFYFNFGDELNAGDNIMNGGNGIDTVDYSGQPSSGLTIRLASSTGNGVGEDHYTSIENVIGTNFNDDIWGNAAVNVMDGRGGRDYFYYSSIGDLNGDRINAFFFEQDGDRIDLTVGLDLSYADITRGRINSAERSVEYIINDHGQTGVITVQFGVAGLAFPDQIFIV